MLAKEHPEVKGAVGRLKRLSFGEWWRAVSDERELRRKDLKWIQDGLREEGRRIGWEQAQKEDQEQAYRDKLEAARNLKAHGVAPELIAGSLKLPPEEVAGL
jgi:O-acetyl-ADP-ribose deacetylase (regulator of RNase III)